MMRDLMLTTLLLALMLGGWQVMRYVDYRAQLSRVSADRDIARAEAAHAVSELERIAAALQQCIGEARAQEREALAAVHRIRMADERMVRAMEEADRLRERLAEIDPYARDWLRQPVPASIAERWR